jgi:hypothetical protein
VRGTLAFMRRTIRQRSLAACDAGVILLIMAAALIITLGTDLSDTIARQVVDSSGRYSGRLVNAIILAICAIPLGLLYWPLRQLVLNRLPNDR